MPRYVNKVVTLSGVNSDEELNSLALLTEKDELIVVYTEKSFLNRQKLLDLIANLGESSYQIINKFIREHHDSDLIYTGLILALEACNYHNTVRWIELKHKRSDRIKYEDLRFYRDHINQFELKLMNFEKGLDALIDVLDLLYPYRLTISNIN